MTSATRIFNSSLRMVFFAVLSLALSACPRGETKSLNEVLNLAKKSYADSLTAATRDGISGEVDGMLHQLTDSLEQILRAAPGSDVSPNWLRAEEILLQLSAKAGYPSRAALTELARECRSVAGVGENPAPQDEAQLKLRAELLAARIYQLLSSELGTIRFGL